jgi:glycosyltransferase involved in cell wall biosynthesis
MKARGGWELTIAGAGPLESEIRRAFSGWPQVALELGWLTDERTAELFSTHHLLLCPYAEASQSGVVAQALSWAMPSLVMAAGALPEQVGLGRAGIIVSQADAAGFRQAIEAVLSGPERLSDLSTGAAALLAERQKHPGWIKLAEAARLDRQG